MQEQSGALPDQLDIRSSEAQLNNCGTIPHGACEVEASVCSGLEEMAKEEIGEKLKGAASSQRGRVNFVMPLENIDKIMKLRCVDNLMLVITRFPRVQFSKSLPEALAQIRSLVPKVNWEQALLVWSKFFKFPHSISSAPQAKYQDKQLDLPDSVSQESVQADGAGDSSSAGNLNTALGQVCLEDASSSSEKTSETSAKAGPAQPNRSEKNPLLPSFRATCYRTGEQHAFKSPQAACEFGGAVNDYFGWNVDLENYDIEVVLCVDDDDVRVCIALTRESLHRRDIVKFGPTTLRPTIAYGMLRMCKIEDGEVVCDPMCGGGSIPVEAAVNWPSVLHLCGDISNQCTARTTNNIRGYNSKQSARNERNIGIDVFEWNICSLPLRDNSVDVFISDLPFGKRSGSRLSNWQLYPEILHEMARVSRVDTGRACLLTHDKRCMIKSLQMTSSLWRRGPTVGINIGGLASCIYMIYRTSQTTTRRSQAAASSVQSGPSCDQ